MRFFKEIHVPISYGVILVSKQKFLKDDMCIVLSTRITTRTDKSVGIFPLEHLVRTQVSEAEISQ